MKRTIYPLIFLCLGLGVLRRSAQAQDGNDPHPSAQIFPGRGTGTISAVLAAHPQGGVSIVLGCGTYVDNVDITASAVRITGVEYQCVTLQPKDPNLPLVHFDATSVPPSGLNFNELSEVSLVCPAPAVCADAVKIDGLTTADQPNDWHKFSRLYILSTGTNTTGTYGFLNGIDISGRTIWSDFTDVWVRGSRNNGVNIVPKAGTMPSRYAAVNDVKFDHLTSQGNYNYGFYLASGNTVNPPEGIAVRDSNIEYNGNNTGLADCAGALFDGTTQVLVENTTFENNCGGNKIGTTAADLRLTGTYNEAAFIHGNTFNQSAGEWGIYNDAVMTTATIDGNKITGATKSIYLATKHPASNIVVGANFMYQSPTIVKDSSGRTHVHGTAPLIFDYTSASTANGSVRDTTLSVPLSSNMAIVSGGPTIKSIASMPPGQILLIVSSGATTTIDFNETGSGKIQGPSGTSVCILVDGSAAFFWSDGTSWHYISGGTVS